MRRVSLVSIFKNMRLKYRLVLAYMALSIIPIFALNIFVTTYTTKLLTAHEKSLLSDALQKATLQAGTKFETYNTLSNYIFSDSVLLTAVNDTYGENYFKMYKAYTYSIEPRFLTYYALHSDLNLLTIYTASDLYPSSTYVAPLQALEKLPWFDDIRNRYHPAWIVDETDGQKHLLSVRRLMKSYKYKTPNYLYMDIDYDSFFLPFTGITGNEYGLTVTDADGKTLFAYGLAENMRDGFDPGAGLDQTKSKGKEYLQLETTYGLGKVFFFQPVSAIVHSVKNILGVTFIILWIVLLLIGLLAFVFSTVLVKPIEDLTKNMQAVQNGNLSVTVSTKRSDEVGIMIKSFIAMIGQLTHLIEVAYKNEIEKKEYQLKLLYAQINPHFLYNALSLINSKALISGNVAISRMALLISSFYRTSLNQGKEMITVENELVNINSYIEIQQLLSSNDFTVRFDVEGAVHACMIPHFILQPVVENAIEHGFACSENGKKQLCLKIREENSRVVIEICDNGAGMMPEVVNGLLKRESKGYGLKNVDHRLSLIYGEDYLFQVESGPGKGTCVTIALPCHHAAQTELA
jgi:two-component system, sensor histidine kinase YesM